MQKISFRQKATAICAVAPSLILPVRALAAGLNEKAPRSLSEIISNPAELLDFLATSLGKSLLVLFFFGLIILFLRLLFGPKGFLREAAWDEWNAKAKEEKKQTKAH